MIICPNCQHQEISGALFCSECGAQLVFSEPISTQNIQREDATEMFTTSQALPVQAPPPPISSDAVISLHLVDSGKILPLAGRVEFSLGRITQGQPILPDIDLTPYDAYPQGVSRLHAALKIVNQRMVIVDLGSSNGTRVNGQKIVPNIDYPLNHGDIIALGRLKIQLLLRH
jgi:FHA domain